MLLFTQYETTSLRGPCPQTFRKSSHFLFWEAVSPKIYCCSPKIKRFGPSKYFGPPKKIRLATPLCHCIAASPVKDVWCQQSHAEKRINYRNLKWTFEDSLPCYCYATKRNTALASFVTFWVCRRRSGHEWTASSSLHHTSI